MYTVPCQFLSRKIAMHDTARKENKSKPFRQNFFHLRTVDKPHFYFNMVFSYLLHSPKLKPEQTLLLQTAIYNQNLSVCCPSLSVAIAWEKTGDPPARLPGQIIQEVVSTIFTVRGTWSKSCLDVMTGAQTLLNVSLVITALLGP